MFIVFYFILLFANIVFKEINAKSNYNSKTYKYI